MQQIPLGSQAVFIRQGAIIPLLDPNIVTLNRVSEMSQSQGIRSRLNEAGALTWLIAPGTNSEYLNHDGNYVRLDENSIYIAPSSENQTIVEASDDFDMTQIERAKILYELPIYPSFILDLRFADPQSTPPEFALDDMSLVEVSTQEEWDTCMMCTWRSSAGKVQIKLPAHQGLDQVITW